MTRAPLFILGLAALVSACDPYQTGPENQNRNTGALGGAAAGAILGAAITGGSGRGIAMGTAAGAILGAGVGEMLDRQAADLRQQMGNDNVTVTNTGSSLVVNFPQDILFATDSATVSASARDELSGLATNLKNYPANHVEIVGHTDNTGTAEHNFDLSNRRASAVSSILVGHGVPTSRITALGRGEDQPVASNLTPEGRAQNRRVEVIIRPTTTG